VEVKLPRVQTSPQPGSEVRSALWEREPEVVSLFDRRVRPYVVVHELEPESLWIRHEEHARCRSDENWRVGRTSRVQMGRPEPVDNHIVVLGHEQEMRGTGILKVSMPKVFVVIFVFDEL